MLSHHIILERQIKIENHNIQWSTQVKYLGIYFERKLNFNSHTKFLTTKVTKTRCMIYPVLNKKCPLSIKTKIQILQMYICLTITYASESWGSQLKKTNWKKLENIQFKYLRTLTNSPNIVANLTIINSAKLPTLKNLIQKQTSNIFYKNQYSEFSHIRQLGKSNPEIANRKKIRPYDRSCLPAQTPQ